MIPKHLTLNRSLRCCFAFLFLLLTDGTLHHLHGEEQVSLSAIISPAQISMEQRALLSITVNGSRVARAELPEVENLVFQRRGQTSKMQIINGAFSSSVTINYSVQAIKEGSYTIPPIDVKVDNKVLKTTKLPFKVVSAETLNKNNANPVPGVSGKKRSRLTFLVVQGLPEKGYAGQIFPITIKAYFREGIRAQIDTIPELIGGGFVLSPLENEPVQKREIIEGVNYLVVSWQASTSAVKEGVQPFQISVDANLLIPKRGRSTFGDDPFFDDDLFSGFFGRVDNRDVTLKTTEQPIEIAPLPQKGRPDDFNGAVGDFTFSAKAEPTEVEVGEPITLTMSISGKGNFDRVTAPQFPENDNWKTYSPSSRFLDQNTSYQGTKLFEQAIVPTSRAAKSLPSLSFSYFDPKKHEYVTTQVPPLSIRITGEDSGAWAGLQAEEEKTLPTPSAQDSEELATPTLQQHLSAGHFSAAILPLYQQTWFIIATILCTSSLALISLVLMRRRFMTRNSQVLEMRQMKKQTLSQLSKLRDAMDAGNVGTFLITSREMIQDHLAYLWGMEPAAISLVDLQNRLEDSSPLIAIFAAAQQYAYGGTALSREEMQQFYTLLSKTMEEKK